MRAHSSLRLGTLRGTTPELLASPWYGAWGFCVVEEAGLPHKTSSSHATPERQSLFESHRQRRWLTRWSYAERYSRFIVIAEIARIQGAQEGTGLEPEALPIGRGHRAITPDGTEG